MNKNGKYFLNKNQSYDNFEGEKRKLSSIIKNKMIKLPPIHIRTSSCGINPYGQNKNCNFEGLNKSFYKSNNKKIFIGFKKFKITNNNPNLGKTQSIFGFSNPLSSLLNVKNNSKKIFSDDNDITNKESESEKKKVIDKQYDKKENNEDMKQKNNNEEDEKMIQIYKENENNNYFNNNEDIIKNSKYDMNEITKKKDNLNSNLYIH